MTLWVLCNTCRGSREFIYTDSVSLEKVHVPCPPCGGAGGRSATVEDLHEALGGAHRACILIDLDERNYDLALERVGPFILQKGTL